MPGTFKPQQGFVLFAKSKKRVSAFYQKTLGLRAVESERSHDLLQGDGYEIVVHTIPRVRDSSFTATVPTGWRLTWKADSSQVKAVGWDTLHIWFNTTNEELHAQGKNALLEML